LRPLAPAARLALEKQIAQQPQRMSQSATPSLSASIPLLRQEGRDLAEHVVAVRRGAPIFADTFLRDVDRVAARLPHGEHFLNLCGDRYHIAVLLAAVMLRNQLSLLPPNTTRETVRSLRTRYRDVVVVTDREADAPDDEGASIAMATLMQNDGETQLHTVHTAHAVPTFPASQVVGILFTSGSTGEPTANVRTWGSLTAGVRAENAALGLDATSTPAVIVGTVPSQHSYGLESTIALALQNGHAFSVDASFYPADIAAAFAHLQSISCRRVLVTTPYHLRVLMQSDETLPALDLIVSATAPLSPQLASAAEARFACHVREIYGCTEAGQLASRRTTEGDAWTLFPGVRLSQVGDVVSAGEGHVGEARELNDVIEPITHETFRLFGRRGDMLNIAGKRTSLAFLNFQLNAIDGVADGVFLTPESDADEVDGVTRLSALVVLQSDSTRTSKDILAELRDRIDAIFLPRPLRIVSEIPRNATGKVTRDALAALDREGTQVAAK
jgi:acyl-coenzyme A synthetase/AMP-(fatty) acid ligase